MNSQLLLQTKSFSRQTFVRLVMTSHFKDGRLLQKFVTFVIRQMYRVDLCHVPDQAQVFEVYILIIKFYLPIRIISDINKMFIA